jgi:hypothetical protein
MLIGLKMKMFGDGMDYWNVLNVVCAFIRFALFEDISRSYLVKIGYEAMKLKVTKSHIFCICVPNQAI